MYRFIKGTFFCGVYGVLWWFNSCLPIAALYPVAHTDNVVLYMHQHADQLQLIAWNNATGVIEPLTPHSINPTNVCLWADKTGLSFIDNGIIKIRSFLQRSSQRIEPSLPLCNPASLSWPVSDWLLMSACYSNGRGIFWLEKRGCVVPILFEQHVTYSYPSWIDNYLFCIRYSAVSDTYELVRCACLFPHIHCAEYDSEQALYEIITHPTPYNELIQFGPDPVILFSMISEHKGYCLQYTVNKEAGMIYFRCYEINNNGAWSYQFLFDYTIPLSFFSSGSPLYLLESITPLLPFYYDNALYYSNFDEKTEKLLPYIYDLNEQARKLIQKTSEKYHFLVPYISEGRIYYGICGDFDREVGFEFLVTKFT